MSLLPEPASEGTELLSFSKATAAPVPAPWECSQSLGMGHCATNAAPTQLSPPGRGSGEGLFSGVPRHKPSQAQRLLLLFAIPSSGKQHVLSVIPQLAALRFQYGSQGNAGPVSFLLNHNTAPVRPALRNQSSSTFFSERAAQGHRAATHWLGKRVWKGNLRHLKH